MSPATVLRRLFAPLVVLIALSGGAGNASAATVINV
ncbi:MAG: hypothetical protein JWM73_3080, partial [Solirubrobacterales bacterium]|nr:hypothetical protein [Solirubrobacterales bacterium]